MDRYDRVLNDIVARTDANQLAWESVAPHAFSQVAIDAGKVIRAFTATYPLDSAQYTLLFLERKVFSSDEFDDFSEYIDFELHVLDESKDLVVSLVDGVVDRDRLIRLGAAINEKNEKTQTFFRAFEEREEAESAIHPRPVAG